MKEDIKLIVFPALILFCMGVVVDEYVNCIRYKRVQSNVKHIGFCFRCQF